MKKYKNGTITQEYYEQELRRLQTELIKLQYWIRDQKMRVIVLFEGRDAAGKTEIIGRITQRLNPRTARSVALGTPAIGNKNNGIFNDTSNIFQPRERWSSSTAVGITALASSGLWNSVPRRNTAIS